MQSIHKNNCGCGIRCFLAPESGMSFSRIRDLGPGSRTHIFESLVTIFGVQNTCFLSIGSNSFGTFTKINSLNYVKFVATKKVGQKFFPLLFFVTEPRSNIHGSKSGSGINIPHPRHCIKSASND
jgi:hypothetical protein